MEEMKKDLSEEVDVPVPIEIPKQPEPSQLDFLVQSMKDMENRLAEANKPKPKRVASQKQLDNLKNAREKRAIMAEKKKVIKKELKENQKVKEKKFVSEKLKEMDNIDEPIEATNVVIPVEAEPHGFPEPDSFTPQPNLAGNTNIPRRVPNPNDENYIKPYGDISTLKFASKSKYRR